LGLNHDICTLFMSNKAISWSIFIVLCLIWGSSFILMKVGSEGLTGTQIAALRIFSSGIVFVPFAFMHLKQIPRHKLKYVCLTGIFGNLLPAFCFAIAISYIDSSLEGILNSLTPLCVAVIAIVFYGDRIRPVRIAGIVIGFLGLCLLSLLEDNISLDNYGYALLVVLATFSYGFNVNLVSHHLKDVKPLPMATVSLSLMAIPSGLVLWWNGFFQLDFSDSVVQWSVFNTLLLGLVGSAFATVLFYALVQRAGGLFASLVTYGIPFVALAWGLIDGEPVGWPEAISLPLILLGVYLARLPDKKTAEPVPPPSDQLEEKPVVKQT